jgi:hypothetical protein
LWSLKSGVEIGSSLEDGERKCRELGEENYRTWGKDENQQPEHL